jgi:4-hydroxy-3-methylbut-2-enyl diphosphate reductase
MNILLASHYGMCFGVRDALRATHQVATQEPVTILGQLVHNPEVDRHLQTLGVRRGQLDSTDSADTARVVITAHGAADRDRQRWSEQGFAITDTTCPLVKKAHQALEMLVHEGYHPVVIGQANHVEVRGLVGDFPQACVLLGESEVNALPDVPLLGVISQTTQPLAHVLAVVEAIKRARPAAEVRFIDTVCRPTKQRQTALLELCAQCDLVVVVGGRNSNNTRQLVETARSKGVAAQQVESVADLEPEWFRSAQNVGVTAGTSTLDETVRDVVDAIKRIA